MSRKSCYANALTRRSIVSLSTPACLDPYRLKKLLEKINNNKNWLTKQFCPKEIITKETISFQFF